MSRSTRAGSPRNYIMRHSCLFLSFILPLAIASVPDSQSPGRASVSKLISEEPAGPKSDGNEVQERERVDGVSKQSILQGQGEKDGEVVQRKATGPKMRNQVKRKEMERLSRWKYYRGEKIIEVKRLSRE